MSQGSSGGGAAKELRLIALPGLPLVEPGDDLAAMMLQALAGCGEQLLEGDVLVVAQKIVSKSEDRLVRLASVQVSQAASQLAQSTGKDPRLVELILRESEEVLRSAPDLIVVQHRLGFVMANAGIDQSNVAAQGQGDFALLLPQDPDASCAALRLKLRAATGVDIGVIINDSHGRAWRNGTVGVAIGAAGVPALLDLRGTPDLFERKLRITEVGAADELAAAASILMGQAGESTPVVLVRGFPHACREGNARELVRPRERDLFR